MSRYQSDLSVVTFDELAIRQQASDLRARWLRSLFVDAWHAIRQRKGASEVRPEKILNQKIRHKTTHRGAAHA